MPFCWLVQAVGAVEHEAMMTVSSRHCPCRGALHPCRGWCRSCGWAHAAADDSEHEVVKVARGDRCTRSCPCLIPGQSPMLSWWVRLVRAADPLALLRCTRSWFLLLSVSWWNVSGTRSVFQLLCCLTLSSCPWVGWCRRSAGVSCCPWM